MSEHRDQRTEQAISEIREAVYELLLLQAKLTKGESSKGLVAGSLAEQDRIRVIVYKLVEDKVEAATENHQSDLREALERAECQQDLNDD